MTTTDALAGYEAGAGKTGRPEWEEDGNKYYLDSSGRVTVNGPSLDHFITDKEALNHWREHVREWLEKRGLFVIRYRGKWTAKCEGPGGLITHILCNHGRLDEPCKIDDAMLLDSIDAAYQAVVRAVEE